MKKVYRLRSKDRLCIHVSLHLHPFLNISVLATPFLFSHFISKFNEIIWNHARVYLFKYNILNKLAPEVLQQWWRYSHTSKIRSVAAITLASNQVQEIKEMTKTSKTKTLNNNLLKCMWDFTLLHMPILSKSLPDCQKLQSAFRSLPGPKTVDLRHSNQNNEEQQ